MELIRFPAYGRLAPVSLAGCLACALVAFLIATIGYDPQRGLIRPPPPA